MEMLHHNFFKIHPFSKVTRDLRRTVKKIKGNFIITCTKIYQTKVLIFNYSLTCIRFIEFAKRHNKEKIDSPYNSLLFRMFMRNAPARLQAKRHQLLTRIDTLGLSSGSRWIWRASRWQLPLISQRKSLQSQL